MLTVCNMNLNVRICSTLLPTLKPQLLQLGRVVQKPVNANPRLKVNRSIDFSCVKMFFILAYGFCSLRLFKLKTCKQKTSPKSYRTAEIKTLANLG